MELIENDTHIFINAQVTLFVYFAFAYKKMTLWHYPKKNVLFPRDIFNINCSEAAAKSYT